MPADLDLKRKTCSLGLLCGCYRRSLSVEATLTLALGRSSFTSFRIPSSFPSNDQGYGGGEIKKQVASYSGSSLDNNNLSNDNLYINVSNSPKVNDPRSKVNLDINSSKGSNILDSKLSKDNFENSSQSNFKSSYSKSHNDIN